MSLDVNQTFASQQKVRAQKRSMKGIPKGKYRHDVTVGLHLSRRTGMCLCLDTCCQDEGGCKCKNCRCRNGEYNHGDVIPDASGSSKLERPEDRSEQDEM
jgi:hypothetical protein